MKRYALIALSLLFLSSVSFSQDTNKVVDWQFNAVHKAGDEFIISIKGTIKPGWKLFSTSMKDDDPKIREV